MVLWYGRNRHDDFEFYKDEHLELPPCRHIPYTIETEHRMEFFTYYYDRGRTGCKSY